MPTTTTMYPDWPTSAHDLVPLPQCEGPKLQPFDFQGPQKIEFLDYVGGGLHSHVFKVEILGCIYALKLFRFCSDMDWSGPDYQSDRKDVNLMSAFANYSEPFNAECRAFGRLQESGNSKLAVQCFGYVLLDEHHEDIMLSKYMDKDYDYSESGNLRFDFKIDENREPDMCESLRPFFPGKDGRPPPIRGIVKEFMYVQNTDEDVRRSTLLRAKRDVIAMQQLGIIHLDVRNANLMDGKLVEFSSAITTPHYVTNPELNPNLTPEWILAMEYETFQYAISDYMRIEDMAWEWNDEHELEKDKIHFSIFPCRRHEPRRRNNERLYSLVDPRLYDWKTFSANHNSRRSRSKTTKGRLARKANKSISENSGAISKTYRKLSTKPPMWYFDWARNPFARGKSKHRNYAQMSTSLEWEFKDGLLYPHEVRWLST